MKGKLPYFVAPPRAEGEEEDDRELGDDVNAAITAADDEEDVGEEDYEVYFLIICFIGQKQVSTHDDVNMRSISSLHFHNLLSLSF
jgi:hypothetical protein